MQSAEALLTPYTLESQRAWSTGEFRRIVLILTQMTFWRSTARHANSVALHIDVRLHPDHCLSLGRDFHVVRFEDTDPAIGKVRKPDSALRIHSEESIHLFPVWERIFSEFSCGRIESVEVGAEKVRYPQISGLLVNHDSVSTKVGCRRLVVRYLFALLIELSKSVVRNVSKPNILLRIHLDSSHGLHVGNRINLYVAGLRVNPEKTRFIGAAGSPGVVMSVQRDVIGTRRP